LNRGFPAASHRHISPGMRAMQGSHNGLRRDKRLLQNGQYLLSWLLSKKGGNWGGNVLISVHLGGVQPVDSVSGPKWYIGSHLPVDQQWGDKRKLFPAKRRRRELKRENRGMKKLKTVAKNKKKKKRNKKKKEKEKKKKPRKDRQADKGNGKIKTKNHKENNKIKKEITNKKRQKKERKKKQSWTSMKNKFHSLGTLESARDKGNQYTSLFSLHTQNPW